MAQVRSFEEAERMINELGLPPHDEYIMLNDGRLLKTPEEVRAWVYSMVDEAPDEGPGSEPPELDLPRQQRERPG